MIDTCTKQESPENTD